MFTNIFGGGDSKMEERAQKTKAPPEPVVHKKIDHAELANKRRLDYERKIQESKKQVIKDMKNSQMNMSMGRGSVKINDMDVSLQDIDMKKLTIEQTKDMKEIERL